MVGAMFIRRTQTRRTEDGKPYFSHRLVHAERLGSTVRQRTLLNLGRHFDIPQSDCAAAVRPRQRCVERSGAAGGRLPACRGRRSARVAAQLIARGPAATTAGPTDVQPVLSTRCGWSAPAASVWSRSACGRSSKDLPALLTRLGVNGALRSAATGALRAFGRARLGARDAPLAAGAQRSRVARCRLRDRRRDAAYRASDALVHREAIEAHLFDRAMGLFDLQPPR